MLYSLVLLLSSVIISIANADGIFPPHLSEFPSISLDSIGSDGSNGTLQPLLALKNQHEILPSVVRLIWEKHPGDPGYRKQQVRRVLDLTESGVTMLPVQERNPGKIPLRLEGETVVFHPLVQHQFTVLGKYNPGLVNSEIAVEMGNKFFEYLFWEEFAPGAMPKTILLKEVHPKDQDPFALQEKLKHLFPQGWVLKGVFDQNTSKGMLITDSDDLGGEIALAEELDAFQIIDGIRNRSDLDSDAAMAMARTVPGFKGWRIRKALKRPHLGIVQEKLNIVREFRVEVIMGRVLAKNTTDRHSLWTQIYSLFHSSNRQILNANQFAEDLIRRLPNELRSMPMALDVALLTDGTYRLIESNPQGNSGFFSSPFFSGRLNDFLKTIPELDKRGELNWGLDLGSQKKIINYLRDKGDMSPDGGQPSKPQVDCTKALLGESPHP